MISSSAPSTSQQQGHSMIQGQQQQQSWGIHSGGGGGYSQNQQQQHTVSYQHPQNNRMPMVGASGAGANQSQIYASGSLPANSAMQKNVHQQPQMQRQQQNFGSDQRSLMNQTAERSLMNQTGELSSDDLNDVATLGDVNLHEEAQKLMAATSIESISQETKSVSDTYLLNLEALRHRTSTICKK